MTRRQPTLVEGAESIHACIARQDTDCILKYFDDEEYARGKFERVKARSFIEKIIWPRTRGFVLSSERQLDEIRGQGHMSSIAVFTSPDGRRSRFEVSLFETEAGPKLIPAISTLYLSSLYLRMPDTDSAGKWRYFADSLASDKDALSSTGVLGWSDMDQQRRPEASFKTWDELIREFRERADRLASSNR
ncbi:MAG: hypothetical protein K1X67_04580 [Fimbriimonadaceae bacterium]|nr:hypothetical protein [Fimbriimonadaceae bacterium]